MAARDAVKRVPEITRNHCPNSAKCAATIDLNDLALIYLAIVPHVDTGCICAMNHLDGSSVPSGAADDIADTG